MKTVYHWIFGMFFLTAASAAGAQTRVQPFENPGKYDQRIAQKHGLKVALRFGYLADNKEAESLRRRTEYNAQGYPLTVYDFNSTGGIQQKATYTYDAAGSAVRQAEIERYTDNADLEEALFYEFDEKGQMIRYRSRNGRGQEYAVGFTYNEVGKLLAAQQFEVDGLPGAADVYAYDEQQRLTEVAKYAVGKTLVERQVYIYDAKGRCIQEEKYRKERLLFRLHRKFDALNRPIRQLRMLSNGMEYGWEEWEYNSQGKVAVHRVMEPEEEKPMRKVYKYDRAGREKEVIQYDSDGSIFQWFKYTHDSTGTGIGYSRHNPDGSIDMLMRERFTRDGRITKRTSDYPDSGKNEVTFTYDAKGLPLKEIHTALGQETAVFWYVFEKY